MNPMIVPARWRQPDQSGGHIFELLEQHQHQVVDVQGMHPGTVERCGHTLPHDVVVVTPTVEARPTEVPPDGSEGSHLVNPKDHVVSFQRNHEEIDDELLLINEDVHHPTNARAGYPIPVRHGDVQADPGQRLEMKPASHRHRDGVRGPEIDQGTE
jgi:hypothetical protein